MIVSDHTASFWTVFVVLEAMHGQGTKFLILFFDVEDVRVGV
jgi:hypothetical protein